MKKKQTAEDEWICSQRQSTTTLLLNCALPNSKNLLLPIQHACSQQQSKNIRINSAIAYNIKNITKKELAIEYMDWKGRVGYMAELFFFQDVVVTHQVDSLYVPKLLLELDNLRSTLKRLYAWKEKKINLSNQIRLAAFEEQRKYMVADISTSYYNEIDQTPSQSPRPIIKRYLTPKRLDKRKISHGQHSNETINFIISLFYRSNKEDVNNKLIQWT